MATYHGGSGQPLERDATSNGKDTSVDILHDYHHEDTGDCESVEQENHTTYQLLLGNGMIYTTDFELEKANPQKPYTV